MQSIFDWLAFLWQEHRGKFIGVIAGLIFGLLTIVFGLGKALIVLLCLAGGYFIGYMCDKDEDFRDFWQRISRRR